MINMISFLLSHFILHTGLAGRSLSQLSRDERPGPPWVGRSVRKAGAKIRQFYPLHHRAAPISY